VGGDQFREPENKLSPLGFLAGIGVLLQRVRAARGLGGMARKEATAGRLLGYHSGRLGIGEGIHA
jgi:hypothetical protein